MSQLRLFCFPYAGGSALVYQKWNRYLRQDILLRPVELAGRGKRINEKMYENVYVAADDLFHIIKEEIAMGPYAFFGHSMGGMLAYEIAQKIRREGLPGPAHIFFSARRPPHISKEEDKKYHLMETDVFKREIINLGGTPVEFFEHPELIELYLPLLKNDFKLSETDLFEGTIHPLDCSITVLSGKGDDLTEADCEEWSMHTRQKCNIHYFEGGHFFIKDYMEGVTGIINNTLSAGHF
ncbi:thioesterase [Chitinophaga polysaccharea]|uniref:thioesterase II family protein n=1 Tax=Chitinophaga TaxID=79328 RepID=UPI0014551277|nr:MULTISPECIES: thioesterase [Chitinophaga]NLR57695.1 thioesterase [Chitinophaga polysaccharea]NLU93287.1 thioesterase [Chitinophaga sp. Ak27]